MAWRRESVLRVRRRCKKPWTSKLNSANSLVFSDLCILLWSNSYPHGCHIKSNITVMHHSDRRDLKFPEQTDALTMRKNRKLSVVFFFSLQQITPGPVPTTKQQRLRFTYRPEFRPPFPSPAHNRQIHNRVRARGKVIPSISFFGSQKDKRKNR